MKIPRAWLEGAFLVGLRGVGRQKHICGAGYAKYGARAADAANREK